MREINIDTPTGDVYLLAGPTMDLDGTISAWRIKGGFPNAKFMTVTHRPDRLFDVVYGGELEYGKDKAEGMAIMQDGNFLVTYDSPTEDRLKGNRCVFADIYRNPDNDFIK